MAKINVSINKKIFTLFCKDGDEKRISLAAETFDQKLNELRNSSPSSSSELLMTICILETQDQLSESIKKLKHYNEETDQNSDQNLKAMNEIRSHIDCLTKKIQDANVK